MAIRLVTAEKMELKLTPVGKSTLLHWFFAYVKINNTFKFSSQIYTTLLVFSVPNDEIRSFEAVQYHKRRESIHIQPFISNFKCVLAGTS